MSLERVGIAAEVGPGDRPIEDGDQVGAARVPAKFESVALHASHERLVDSSPPIPLVRHRLDRRCRPCRD